MAGGLLHDDQSARSHVERQPWRGQHLSDARDIRDADLRHRLLRRDAERRRVACRPRHAAHSRLCAVHPHHRRQRERRAGTAVHRTAERRDRGRPLLCGHRVPLLEHHGAVVVDRWVRHVAFCQWTVHVCMRSVRESSRRTRTRAHTSSPLPRRSPLRRFRSLSSASRAGAHLLRRHVACTGWLSAHTASPTL
jgi:hypothetical protein